MDGFSVPKTQQVMIEVPVPGADFDRMLREFKTIVDELKQELQAIKKGGDPLSYSELEAAAVLEMGEITLARLRRAGRISYTPVAGKARYTKAHLEDYLSVNTKPRAGRKR